MDENLYIEFVISGAIKTTNERKAEVIERLQIFLSELLNDEELELIQFDESFKLISGTDVISDVFGSLLDDGEPPN